MVTTIFVVAAAAIGGILTFWLRRHRTAHVCRNCTHFDLEEGQAALRQNPVFVRVMEATTPAEHSRASEGLQEVDCAHCEDKPAPDPECTACKGTGRTQIIKRGPPSLPLKARWSEMGACLCEALGDAHVRWGGDGLQCKEWNGPLFQLRRKDARREAA